MKLFVVMFKGKELMVFDNQLMAEGYLTKQVREIYEEFGDSGMSIIQQFAIATV